MAFEKVEKRVLKPEQAEEVVRFLTTKDAESPWTKEEVLHLWDGMPDRITLYDLRALLYFCKINKLQPLLDEVVCEYKWGGDKNPRYIFTKIIRIDGYRRRGSEIMEEMGETYGKDENGTFVDVAIKLSTKPRPTSARRYLNEYKAVAGPVAAKMPLGMCAKAAEMLCWKKLGILTGGDMEDENYFDDGGQPSQAETFTETVAGYKIGAKADPAPTTTEVKTSPVTSSAPTTTQPTAAPATSAPVMAPAPKETAPVPPVDPPKKDPPPPTAKSESGPAETKPEGDPLATFNEFKTLAAFDKAACASFWKGWFAVDNLAKPPADRSAYAAGSAALLPMMYTPAARRANADPQKFGVDLRAGTVPEFGSSRRVEEVKGQLPDDASGRAAVAIAVLIDVMSLAGIPGLLGFLDQYGMRVKGEADQIPFLELAATCRTFATVNLAAQKSNIPLMAYLDAIVAKVGDLKTTALDKIDVAAAEVIAMPPSTNGQLFGA